LTHFGDLFQALRKAKKYSYNNLSETSGIAKNTLRNIERGIVVPNLETMTLLSNYLDADLAALFLTCKNNRHTQYEYLKHTFEMMISAHKTNELLELMSSMESLLSEDTGTLEESRLEQQILQLYYRMIGHYETYIKKDDLAAFEAFLSALKVTMPEFNLKDYDQLTYNYDELHILFNIIQMKDRQERKKNHITMYEFIYEVHESLMETEVNLFPLLVNNLAVTLLDWNNYEEALHYANIGLRYLDKKQIAIDMPALLLCKGIIFHYMKNEYADHYIKLCFDLLMLSNRPDLAESALRDLKAKHNINFTPANFQYTEPVNTRTKEAVTSLKTPDFYN